MSVAIRSRHSVLDKTGVFSTRSISLVFPSTALCSLR